MLQLNLPFVFVPTNDRLLLYILQKENLFVKVKLYSLIQF